MERKPVEKKRPGVPSGDPSRHHSTAEDLQPDPAFQVLFESAPDLYLALTPDLRVAAATDAYLLATMVTREEIVGREVLTLFPHHPGDHGASAAARLESSLRRVLRERQADEMAEMCYPVLGPAGEGAGLKRRSWRVINSPIFGSDGTIIYILHNLEELAERDHPEQVPAAIREDTEDAGLRAGMVDAATFFGTQELLELNRRLSEANSELEDLCRGLHRLDEIKATMSAAPGDNLRSRLSQVMKPVNDLLALSQLSKSEKRNLESVKKSALALLKHANDLLDVSRLKAGTLRLDYSEVDLADLVRRTAAHFDGVARTRLIQYVVEAPGRLLARIDSDKIRRLLANLLTNAFKIAPDTGAVSCSLLHLPGDSGEEARGSALLSVTCSGQGVPPELHAAIFQNLFQAEPQAGLRLGGTGLGLAIAREFVNLHHGAISVETAPEGGPLVKVEIPLEPPAGLPPRATTDGVEARASEVLQHCLSELDSQAAAPRVPARRSDGPLLLIIGDDEGMSRRIRQALSSRYRVLTASDTVEGLTEAGGYLPDLILVDEMVTRGRGARTVGDLRSNPDLDPTPIVMLTSRPDEMMLRSGVQDFLQKPFSDTELLARLESLVAVKRARDLLQSRVAASGGSLERVAMAVTAQIEDLERSNEDLRQFAYIVSHDLKEPLRMVCSYVQLLADKYGNRLSGEAEEFMEFAVEGTERMHRMIDDLLAYCSVSSREVGNSLASSEAALSRALDNLRLMIRKAGAVVTHDPLPPVAADEPQLTQLFQNLIGNAVKFRGASDPRVHVAAERGESSWLFKVTDNGIGIDPRHAKRVFVIFSRLNPRDKYPGTGIGLAICHRIVSRHGGRIWVEPRPTGGSRFCFTLPVNSRV